MNFLLTSEDWYILMPDQKHESNFLAKSIYGDTLIVDARTDVDGFVVSWGEKLTKNLDCYN